MHDADIYIRALTMQGQCVKGKEIFCKTQLNFGNTYSVACEINWASVLGASVNLPEQPLRINGFEDLS